MMPAPAEFLDTNILVYAFTTDPRAAITEQLLERIRQCGEAQARHVVGRNQRGA